jgi:N-acyl-L-homoserine lactone synthetase
VTTWTVCSPPGAAQPGWLDEIREFRARILYDDGRRPGFRRDDGGFAEDDSLDAAAYHVSARFGGHVVGCVRLLPLSDVDRCFTEQLIGSASLEQVLHRLRVSRAETIEGGRWVVDPAHRRSRLGVLLAAGGVAVARALEYRMLCAVQWARRAGRIGCWPASDWPRFQTSRLLRCRSSTIGCG